MLGFETPKPVVIETPADRPTSGGLLHGIEELPPAERAHYEQAAYYRQPTQQVNRYVSVVGTDYLGKGFCESVAREIEMNPQLAPLLQRVERNAQRYAKSYQTSEKLGMNNAS